MFTTADILFSMLRLICRDAAMLKTLPLLTPDVCRFSLIAWRRSFDADLFVALRHMPLRCFDASAMMPPRRAGKTLPPRYAAAR